MRNYKYNYDQLAQDSLFEALEEIAETYVSPLSQAQALRSYLINQEGHSESEADFIVRERFEGLLQFEDKKMPLQLKAIEN